MIEIEEGKTAVYRITADLSESQPSLYSTLQLPDPAIAELISSPSFSAYNYGRYRIEGKQIGETSATFEWEYPPNNASAFCQVTIKVVPRKPRRRSTSGATGDPVNTHSGELYFLAEPDIYLPGPMPLYFQRYYGSRLFCDAEVHSSLGNNWMHNYEHRLDLYQNLAIVTFFKGLSIEFLRDGDHFLLVEPRDTPFKLIKDGNDYLLLNPQDWTRYRFDAEGKLRAVLDRNGNQHTVIYQMNGADETQRISRVQDGLGRSLEFATVGFETLASVTDGTGTQQASFNVSFDRELSSFRNSLNQLTGYIYNDGLQDAICGASFNQSAALLTQINRPLGNPGLTATYDNVGRAITQGDALGNQIQLSYDGATTLINSPISPVMRHVHDNDGNLVQLVDPSGATASFDYEGSGRRSDVTDKLGDDSGVTYHTPSGRIASRTSASGDTTTYQYTAQFQEGFTFYNLSRINHSDGTRTDYSYDSRGNLTVVNDRAGGVTSYTYDPRGQITRVVQPGGATLDYTYDPSGMLATETIDGESTAYDYDTLFRLRRITHPDGTTREIEYDPLGRITADTDELGNRTEYEYDANGNRVLIEDVVANTRVILRYDQRDLLEEVENEIGELTTYVYDSQGRLADINKPGGDSMTIGYDADGRPTTLTDADGNTSTTLFDSEGVPEGFVNPLGMQWSLTTDRTGLVTDIDTPLGHQSHYQYNEFGDLLEVTNSEGGKTRFSYDDGGLVTRIELPDGSTSELLRNDFGFIESITDPDGNEWDRDYDNEGRLVLMVDPLGRETRYDYNDQGFPETVTFPPPFGTMTTTYDVRGLATRKAFSGGLTVDFNYDQRGNLTSANGLVMGYDDADQVVSCNGQTMTRDPQGRLATVEYAPGKVVTYSYNSVGLLESVTDWVGGSTQFTYDDATQLVDIMRPNGSLTSYTHDDDGRLIRIEEEPSGARSVIDLILDGEGRVIQAERQTPVHPNYSLFEMSTRATDEAYQDREGVFDSLGRLTGDSERTYTWDAGGRLVQLVDGAGTTDYTYDAFGGRLSATRGSVVREYLINYAFALPALTQVSDASVPLAYYIYTPDGRLLHRVDAANDARRFYHFDEVGHTLCLTDDSNTITDGYHVTPYGEAMLSSGSTENPFIFCGAQGVVTDQTGLFYMRARYYDPERVAFVSLDPVSSFHPLMVNPYQYALGNPMLYTDPTGRGPEGAQSADLFTPDNPGFINDSIFTAVEKGFETAARNNADEALKHWRLFPRNTPIPDLSDAVKNAKFAGFADKAGTVFGFAIDGYQEYSQAREEGKGVGQSLARGGLGGGVSVAVGAANPVVALIDGVTGENFSHSIKQTYRVPEALLGSEADGRAYRKAAQKGDYGWLVQVTDFAGNEFAEKGVGGVLGGITSQGFTETIDAWGIALFGAPEPYVLPESARKRIQERIERQRRESERRNRENQKQGQ